ncbi:MAG TPA: MotA/TolQ/ExbB proton channel family protein [Polyangiaceae bacterium]|nr:MotA/TolQ/ExbB proton channel family protein [Polyangiaceae bacterium]
MSGLLQSLLLLDPSGYAIIGAIVTLLVLSLLVTMAVRARYLLIARDLRRNAGPPPVFDSPVLARIVRETLEATRARGANVNSQALIEQAFQAELKSLLLGERFIKAATGLVIILGLVGTFYGLTQSIGTLAALISEDPTRVVDVTESLTRGLTEALSGMSTAFTTSLFGIGAAIVMTLVGVFASVPDRRLAVMIEIETYLETLLPGTPTTAAAGGAEPAFAGGQRLDLMTAGLANSVAKLEGAVERFDDALSKFSATTRDFREFNLHLKDNVQRLSLAFGDLSETMKQHVAALRRREDA